MTTLNDFSYTDDVDDVMAAYVNELQAATLRAEFANTETISATKELGDGDTPFQVITASGADRTVELAPEGANNHVTVIYNAGASNNVVVKDDSGAVTLITLAPDEWALCVPVLGETWKVIENRATLKKYFDTLYGTTGNVNRKYIITPSISSNNLVVALKYIDGTDPSSTKKLYFRVGDTEYELTAAMSFTKNAGTNWCNAGGAELAAKDVDYFLYAIGETGASAGLKFGWSRIPYATVMGDFVNTNTSEKYIAGNWTNFNATDPVTVIGRFRAQLSAGAGYTWTIPTAKVINAPVYETDVLTWQPVYSASGSMTFTSVVTDIAEYQIRHRQLSYECEAHGTTGGTASISVFATVPFEARNVANQMAAPAWVLDTGASGIGAFAYVGAGTPDRLAFQRYDSANWSLGTGRYINANGKYFI